MRELMSRVSSWLPLLLARMPWWLPLLAAVAAAGAAVAARGRDGVLLLVLSVFAVWVSVVRAAHQVPGGAR